MQKPRALRRGDTIGLVAPAGALTDADALQGAVCAIERLGFRAKLGASCTARHGYLAGPDSMRAGDLNRMFLDREVRAIACLRGGYGSARILDMLNFEAAWAHPKLLIGYSDITALHAAYGRRAGLVTLHGPMPGTEWRHDDFDAFSQASLLQALTSMAPGAQVLNPPSYPLHTLHHGRAEGRMVGGNLCVIASLIGTPYELIVDGRLLLLEEVGEAPYRVDRMLTQLRLAGYFERCAGVVLGDFSQCEAQDPQTELPLARVFEDTILGAGVPVLSGFQIGHCAPMLSAALGARYALDADEKSLCLMESPFVV